MSTKINVTIGNARLLQASQRRVAANQQALNTRTEQKQDAAKAEEVVDREVVQPESERRSGILDTVTPRRPAAHRRLREEEEEDFELRSVDKSIVSVLGAKIERLPDTVVTITASYGVGGVNSYSEQTLEFAPVLRQGGEFEFLQTFVQPNTRLLSNKDWVYQIRSVSGSFIGGSYEVQISEPSPHPRQTIASPGLFPYNRTLSVTPTHMFFSCVIAQRIYNVGFETVVQAGGSSTTFQGGTDFTLNYIGYYSRFNFKNKILTEKQVVLSSTFVQSLPSSATSGGPAPSLDILADHIGNFYGKDPRKELYEQSGASSLALDWNINTFAYSPRLGFAYFYGPKREPLFEETGRRYVYGTVVEKFTPYQDVYFTLLEGKNLLAIETTAPEIIKATFNKVTFVLMFDFETGYTRFAEDDIGGPLGNFYGIRPPRKIDTQESDLE